jgi:hypothetical protein
MSDEMVTCEICDEQSISELLQQCFSCSRTYHLNPFSNKPGRDCGDAVIGESLGVYYYCRACMEQSAN